MDGIAALSTALSTARVMDAVNIQCLKKANAAQQNVMSLLEAAVEVAEAIQQDGVGEQIDTYA